MDEGYTGFLPVNLQIENPNFVQLWGKEDNEGEISFESLPITENGKYKFLFNDQTAFANGYIPVKRYDNNTEEYDYNINVNKKILISNIKYSERRGNEWFEYNIPENGWVKYNSNSSLNFEEGWSYIIFREYDDRWIIDVISNSEIIHNFAFNTTGYVFKVYNTNIEEFEVQLWDNNNNRILNIRDVDTKNDNNNKSWAYAKLYKNYFEINYIYFN